jgi:hypothetical protein
MPASFKRVRANLDRTVRRTNKSMVWTPEIRIDDNGMISVDRDAMTGKDASAWLSTNLVLAQYLEELQKMQVRRRGAFKANEGR